MIKWKKPDFDNNLFISDKTIRIRGGFLYNSNELLELIEYSRDYIKDKPVLIPIIKLLLATHVFRSATTLDPEFVESRKFALDANPKAPLDKAAYEISNALIFLQSLKPGSQDYQLCESAIEYCVRTIRKRMHELRMQKDAIYEKGWRQSLLRPLLEKENNL